MELLNIWNSIKDKVVNASNAVFGAAKSVGKGVGSVAGKAKNIILRRDEELQGVINDCVKSLNELLNSERKDKIILLNSVLGAFVVMIKNEKFEKFIGNHSGEKKGFAGFANFLSDQLKDVNKIEGNNNEETLGKALDRVKTKVLRVLSRVKKYSGVGSRVNAFVGPCKVLYGMVADFGTPKGSKAVSSYFGKACEHLRSAAAKKSGGEQGFRESMCDAYDAVCKMCKYEKLGKKGDKGTQTASGEWYSKYGKSEIKEADVKVKAVLNICNYKSGRGFVKRFFKGQTKWQELCTLVEKAKNNGLRIGVLVSEGDKLSVKQDIKGNVYTPGLTPTVPTYNNDENKNKEITTPTPKSTSSNVFPANSNSDGFSVFKNSQNGGMSGDKENEDPVTSNDEGTNEYL